MISPVSFNGVALNDDFFKSDLLDVFNADKDLTLNDLLGDGQAWGSSKVSERKLVLNIVAGAHDLRRLMLLNQMVRGNRLKPLVIDTDIGRLIGQAEVTNFAWSDDSPLIISAQLTMPDPYWYAQTAKVVQLGATYSNGVVFGAGRGVTFGPRNVITNGNFANGTTGWLAHAAALSVDSQVLSATANGTDSQLWIQQLLDTSNHSNKWFVHARVKASGTNVPQDFTIQMYDGSTVIVAKKVSSIINDTWYDLYGFVTTSSSSSSSGNLAIKAAYASTSAENGMVVQIDGTNSNGVMAVDMGTDASNPFYNLTADQMAAKYTDYQQEYGGVVFGASTGGAATITNEGNADAYPVIHVVGTCSGPSVTNLTTGETVSANVALGDDDELVIDCRPATCGVYLNGVADIGLKSSPGWMRCVPGDNQIVFSRNSLQNKKHCTVELNERWI